MVNEISLYYDARSKKKHKKRNVVSRTQSVEIAILMIVYVLSLATHKYVVCVFFC